MQPGSVLIGELAPIPARPTWLARFSVASGFGVAFVGGRRSLVAAIPSENRAAVMSAFYIVACASLSVPAVLAGIVVTQLGLQSTFETFGSIVAGIALIVAVEAWRTRPTTARGNLRPDGSQT